MKSLSPDELENIDRIRCQYLGKLSEDLPDGETDNLFQIAAVMMEGFHLMMCEDASEQWMRDKFISMADDISRYKLSRVGFDVE